MVCVKCAEPVDEQAANECISMDMPPCCDECHEDVSDEVANGHLFWPEDWHGFWAWSQARDVFLPCIEKRIKVCL